MIPRRDYRCLRLSPVYRTHRHPRPVLPLVRGLRLEPRPGGAHGHRL